MNIQIEASDEIKQDLEDFLKLFRSLGMQICFANEGVHIHLKIKTLHGAVFDLKIPRNQPFIISNQEETP